MLLLNCNVDIECILENTFSKKSHYKYNSFQFSRNRFLVFISSSWSKLKLLNTRCFRMVKFNILHHIIYIVASTKCCKWLCKTRSQAKYWFYKFRKMWRSLPKCSASYWKRSTKSQKSAKLTKIEWNLDWAHLNELD